MSSNPPPSEAKTQEYEFEQMNLQVGGRIQFITHRTIKPIQHFSTVIGWVKDEYLIVKVPFEGNTPLTEEEARQCVAVFRFIIPDASIRLAGGRGLLDDKGKECFQSGANAAISGDMLTTAGITVQKDMEMLKDLGYKPQLWED